MTYKFTIEGQPIPLKRHRQGRHGNYDPSREDKAIFLSKFQEWAWDKRHPEWITSPTNEPIVLTCNFFFSMPKSWSHKKKRRMAGEGKPTKPDLSNLIKFVEDALEHTAFTNDSRIVFIMATKIYTANEPCTVIEIEPIKEYEQRHREQ